MRASLYRLGTQLFIDRCPARRAGDWRAALAWRARWTPPGLPISGADALALGLKPGPKVGALIEAVERWWIDRRLFRPTAPPASPSWKRLADDPT